MGKRLTIGFAVLFFLANAAAVLAKPNLTQIKEFVISEANQAVAVDDRYFYAIDNQTIAKYDKKTGAPVKKWKGDKNGPIIHLDSAMLMDGKIYCSHSNYNEWPMTSSLEIWDADTLEHIGNHSFGIQWGSLTWADFHDGHWWMTFANYDKPYGPGKTPYGYKATTQMIKFSADFKFEEAWVLPKSILDRFEDMSNSGGSWGPRRLSVPFGPRPGGDLQDAPAQIRLCPRTCRRDSDEHPGPGNRLGPQRSGGDLRDHPGHGQGEGRRQKPQGDPVQAGRGSIDLLSDTCAAGRPCA